MDNQQSDSLPSIGELIGHLLQVFNCKESSFIILIPFRIQSDLYPDYRFTYPNPVTLPYLVDLMLEVIGAPGLLNLLDSICSNPSLVSELKRLHASMSISLDHHSNGAAMSENYPQSPESVRRLHPALSSPSLETSPVTDELLCACVDTDDDNPNRTVCLYHLVMGNFDVHPSWRDIGVNGPKAETAKKTPKSIRKVDWEEVPIPGMI